MLWNPLSRSRPYTKKKNRISNLFLYVFFSLESLGGHHFEIRWQIKLAIELSQDPVWPKHTVRHIKIDL